MAVLSCRGKTTCAEDAQSFYAGNRAGVTCRFAQFVRCAGELEKLHGAARLSQLVEHRTSVESRELDILWK